MDKTTASKVRLFYGIFLSVFTVVLGICFIVGAAQIYDFGEGEYTREIVGAKLKPLLIVMIFWIAAIVGGYVLSILFPTVGGKKKAPSAAATVKRLQDKIPDGKSEEFAAEKKLYDRGEIIRIAIYSACAAFALASAIVSIVYLASGAHFDTQNSQIAINTLIVGMVKNLLPWIAISFLLFVGATLYDYFTAKKKLERIKKLLVLGKGSPKMARSAILQRKDAVLAVAGKPKVKLAIRIAILTLAIVFIVLGNLPINQTATWFAGWNEVMTKAINICTECIGLG